MIVMHPVSQAMENHLANNRVVPINGVSTTRIVFVVSLVGFKHVVDRIFKPFEAEHRAVFVAFASMIEHDVQNHFDPCFVQGFDHLLELTDLGTRCWVRRVATMRREEGHRIVTPIVGSFKFVTIGRVNRKLVNRHQLDRCHAQ